MLKNLQKKKKEKTKKLLISEFRKTERIWVNIQKPIIFLYFYMPSVNQLKYNFKIISEKKIKYLSINLTKPFQHKYAKKY